MSDLRKHINYLPSQENVGCCASSATLVSLEILMSMSGRPTHFSRLFPYYNARKMQNRSGQAGTGLKDILESIMHYGVCLNRCWPFSPHRANKEPNVVAYQDADQYKISEYLSVDPNEFNSYIDQGIPVIIGLRIGRKFKSMENVLADQVYMPVNSTNNRYSHGHAVTIVGYKENGWIIANSFGLTWGDHGYGFLPYECSVDIGEAYVVRSFNGISAGEKN